MLSHVFIGVSDFASAVDFYAAIMAELGYPLKFQDPAQGWAGWMPRDRPRPLFLIGRPYDGNPAQAGNGHMVALLASTRGQVDRTYVRALALGARSEGAPGLRPHYHPEYYGAYFRDADGNKICLCCHNAHPA